VRPVLLLFLLSLPAAFPQAAHQHHPPRSAEEYARVLNDPKRDAWELPDDVVKALELRHDEVIAISSSTAPWQGELCDAWQP